MKTTLTQGPGRLTVVAGRYVVFQGWLLALVALMFGAAATSSVGVALLQGHPITWPAGIVILKGMGAAWLAMGTYGSLGLLLGYVFRQAAVALGVGLIYLALIEDLLLNFLNTFNQGQLKWLADLLDGQNAMSLLAIFTSPAFGRVRLPEVDVTHAVVALAAYVSAFVVLSAFIFSRRDVA